MMIRSWGGPRAEVDVIHEQPLPWNASQVHIGLPDGEAYTCEVTRWPGDLLHLELDGVILAVDTPVEIQWTMDNRGCYASGTVVLPPSSMDTGIFVRIDESVSGVERRTAIRVPVRITANLVAPSGQVFPGRSMDLSLGGAHLAVDAPSTGETLREALQRAGVVQRVHAMVVLTLPTGVANVPCLITSIDREPGEVRLRFVYQDGCVMEQIGALLRAEQHRIALHQD